MVDMPRKELKTIKMWWWKLPLMVSDQFLFAFWKNLLHYFIVMPWSHWGQDLLLLICPSVTLNSSIKGLWGSFWHKTPGLSFINGSFMGGSNQQVSECNSVHEKNFFLHFFVFSSAINKGGFWVYRSSFIENFHPLLHNLVNDKLDSVMVALCNYLREKRELSCCVGSTHWVS